VITVRPSRPGFSAIIASGVGLAIAGFVGGIFRGHSGFELFGPSLIALAVAVALAFGFRQNARVELQGDTVTVRSLIGTSRTFPVDDVATVVDAYQVDTGSGPSGRIAFLGSEGFALLRLNATYWEVDSLRTLTAAFGERLETLEEPVTVRQLIARHPHALNFRTQHPFITFVIIFVSIAISALTYVWLLETV